MRRRAVGELEAWLERAASSGLSGLCSRDPCGHRGGACCVHSGVEQRADRGEHQPPEVHQASGLRAGRVRPAPAARPATGGLTKRALSSDGRERRPFTQSASDPYFFRFVSRTHRSRSAAGETVSPTAHPGFPRSSAAAHAAQFGSQVGSCLLIGNSRLLG